jgi:hypothetical protein
VIKGNENGVSGIYQHSKNAIFMPIFNIFNSFQQLWKSERNDMFVSYMENGVQKYQQSGFPQIYRHCIENNNIQIFE